MDRDEAQHWNGHQKYPMSRNSYIFRLSSTRMHSSTMRIDHALALS